MKDSVHLQAKIHNEVKGSNIDCDCYKGGHTSERVFYYLEGKTVKVCDIFQDHNEYERVVNSGKVLKKNYHFA